VRPDLDLLPQLGDRFIVAALGDERAAELVVEVGDVRFRIGVERRAEFGLGAPRIARRGANTCPRTLRARARSRVLPPARSIADCAASSAFFVTFIP